MAENGNFSRASTRHFALLGAEVAGASYSFVELYVAGARLVQPPEDPPIRRVPPFSQHRRGVDNHEHRAVGLEEIQPIHFNASPCRRTNSAVKVAKLTSTASQV